jgi:CrcB protein
MAETVYDFLSVGGGAIIGASCRWLILINFTSIRPWATFSVNMLGTLILGIFYGIGTAINSRILLFIGTGFCGSLTTFSTFAYDVIQLIKQKDYLQVSLYVFFSVLGGILLAAAGYEIGNVIAPKSNTVN